MKSKEELVNGLMELSDFTGCDHVSILNDIPKKKRDNVLKGYGSEFNSDKEEMLLLFDKTCWGSAKEGFFLTTNCLYQNLEKKNQNPIPLSEISTLEIGDLAEFEKPLIVNGKPIGSLTYGTDVDIFLLISYFKFLTGQTSEKCEKYLSNNANAVNKKNESTKNAHNVNKQNEMAEEELEKQVSEVKKQIAELGQIDDFGTKKEIRYLPEILFPDEKIKALTSGLMNGNTWLITCTDRRIIFLDKGMVYGLEQVETPLDKINSITQKTGLLYGEIAIWDGASQMKIENAQKGSVKPFVEAVNKAIHEQKQVNNQPHVVQQAQVDPAAQIEKFAELKEKGIITEEEFTAKKKELLGL